MDHEGETQYDYFRTNFGKSSHKLLKNYPKSIFYSTHDIECMEDCSDSCKDKMLAFRINNGVKLNMLQASEIGYGGESTVYSGQWHKKGKILNLKKVI